METNNITAKLTAPYYTSGQIAELLGVKDTNVIFFYAKRAGCWIDTWQRPMLIENGARLIAAVERLQDDIAHGRVAYDPKQKLCLD